MDFDFNNTRDYLRKMLDEQEAEDLMRQVVPYQEFISYYNCAMMEVTTKFNVLNEEFSLSYDRNPIETIKSRLKSPQSLVAKMMRLNLDLTMENIEKNIFDIAGIRVICSFPSDVYMLAHALLRQDDVTLVQEKDYIKNPKPSGYRSLHLIIRTPIFLHDRTKMMHVEVQLRTISMDWWASTEHKIRYKKDLDFTEEMNRQLLECANIAANLDKKMDELHHIAYDIGNH